MKLIKIGGRDMNGIILHEVIIYNALESVIDYIRKDLSEHNGKE